MSTALRKEEPVLPDPDDTLSAHIVRIETATETMMAYIGYLNTRIHTEEDQLTPNQAKLQALKLQKNVLLEERRAISSDTPDLIAKALYIYAPLVKAIYKSHG